MFVPDNCRETFLDGVTDVYFHDVEHSSIPVPPFVAQIMQINNCSFSEPALHIAMSEGENSVLASSITAKETPSQGGNGTVYTFEVSVNVLTGGNLVREASKLMKGKDYYIVLRRRDESLWLCYTLAHTFRLTTSSTATNSSESRTVTATCKAMSDFIPIQLE